MRRTFINKSCLQRNTDGVLERFYAVERTKKEYLKFRYRTRALVARPGLFNDMPVNKAVFALLISVSADGLALTEMACIIGNGDFLGIEYNRELIDQYTPNLLKGNNININLIQGDVNHLESIKAEETDIVTALAIFETSKNSHI